MVDGKGSFRWTGLVIMAVVIALMVSCSGVTPSPSVQSSPVPESTPEFKPAPATAEVSPGPTTRTEPPLLSYRDLGRFVNTDPATIDNSGFPITPVEEIHRTGSPRDVDINSYRLAVDGLVDHALSLSYQDLLQYAPLTRAVLLICPGFFVDNADWTGVPVKTILSEAGLKPEAREVIFHSVDGYQQYFPLQDVLKDGVFLAYQVNGQTLPREHGYPLQLVVQGAYGSKWAKWVNRVEVN